VSCLLAAVVVRPAFAAGERVDRVRIAFDERLSASPVLAAAIDAMGGRAPAFPVLARITVDLSELQGDDSSRFARLEQRLAVYQQKKIPVWLALDASSAQGESMSADDWARMVRGLAPKLTGRVRVFELIVPAAGAAGPAAIALNLKRAAVELRAVVPDITIALGAAHLPARADLERLYTDDLASYVDALVVTPHPGPLPASGAREGAALEEMRAWLDRVDRSALIFEQGRALSGGADAAARTFVTGELWRLGSPSAVASYDARAEIVRAALTQAAPVQDLLGDDLTRIDDKTANLTITRDDGKSVRAALLYDVSTFGTYLVYAADDGASAKQPARVTLTIATEAKPRVRDPFATTTARRMLDVTGFTREKDAQRSTFTAPLSAHPLIVDFNDALGDVVTERNDVTARDMLSVGEIIARHQQAQAAQDAALEHYTASARMEQHFRPSIADPGYDVVTENRFYVDRDGVEWEELSFSVNGSKWKEDRPAFPLLQPEKVLSVPLTLRLSNDYTYRLEGMSRLDNRDCYVVHFEPAKNNHRSLYRGTIWIDAASFVQRKLQAVQTKLSAPVVSNEETHYFAPVGRINDREIVLPVRMISKQIVLVAGRNMLVEKSTLFADHRVNDDGFRDLRQSARASNRIMYRDTERGVRYYVKEAGERVVSDRSTTSAKAMAMGVTLDPSFDFPLPIFGINYLDFDFGGPDSQLALLFGGVLALGNVQRPKLLGTPLDASVDFFAIAVPGSDKLYADSGERELERILTWPMSTGVNVGYQFTSFQKLAMQYQFKFDAYVRDRTTAEDFTLPKSTTTHGIGLTYEYRRRGYSIATNGTWYGRARWAPWGPAGAERMTDRTYEKYSLNVSKDWFFGLFQKVHVNGAYFGGRGLDRFSQYQFGLFDDTRIHGVPASGVRMSELGMARGSYTFNIFEQYRFDVFLEQAFGQDKERLTGWEPITGIGTALNVKGPWNTILRVDAGKSFLPSRYRANGSTVVQILMLKPLK
jgi:hypothetical protein